MNLLFVSSQKATAAAGPNWSIPARVKAQSEIDNVYWINLNDTEMPHWRDTGVFHTLSEIGGKLRLSALPKEFQHPDMVFFEVPYFLPFIWFSSELRRSGIPYIIVPRCSFTKQAMNNHSKWKKKFANWLLFNRFFKGAYAIQYLTEQEKQDSEPFICRNSFIIPNGINIPPIFQRNFDGNELKGLFIGRIDIYHKGLDLLLETVRLNADFLRNNKVTFSIYGPINSDYETLKSNSLEYGVDDIFLLNGEVSGKEKVNVLRNSDFFIMTSRFEGLPMAMLEALSYGLPCIASEGSYMDKVVVDSGAGIGCGSNVDDISNALKILILNKRQLHIMSDNAVLVASNYDWNKQAKRLHEYLNSLE